MQLKKLSLILLLTAVEFVSAHEDLCKNCPTPCAKLLEELENMPSRGPQSYERKKEILYGKESSQVLSLADLEELKETAKNEGDFETHAEAYHRLKIEVGTEDGGKTLVFRVKDLALPVVVTTVIAGGLGAFLTHYFGTPQKSNNSR